MEKNDAVVYYAGDVKNLFRLIHKVRSCNERLKKQAFEFLIQYKEITSELHFPWRMPVFTLDKEKDALVNKVFAYIEKILFDYSYKFEENDCGVLHAVYLVLLNLYVQINEARYIEAEEQRRRFYAGHGFGEFWAITKYLEWYFTMSEIICFAYEYGKTLESFGNDQDGYNEFVKFTLPSERYQVEKSLFSSKYVGKCIDARGNVELYANVNELRGWNGFKPESDDLVCLEECTGVKFEKSAPLYSMNLYDVGCAFAAKHFMPYEKLAGNIIRMKITISDLLYSTIVYEASDTIIEQIARTFYKEFDGYKLFKKIERKLKKYNYSIIRV